MKSLMSCILVLSCGIVARAQEPGAVVDRRLTQAKDYNGYFPWTPPQSKEAWQVRRRELREQVLVATGLYPMPDKLPLQPVIHGKIERPGYTIEKVYFASLPGHYVSGNLYRPADKAGKHPGVLCPHGHWAEGRFYQSKDAASQIKQGAEQTKEGALYPLQARCAQLARLGCVVFHYDMVGYADSQALTHRQGFTDPEAELRLQSFMGLQTFNSVRALDFLASLPDVDVARIGVTGASGGGTQTFILCALDDRPAAAFPAVMVGTAMQGGCVCENASYLRIGTGNVELAGLFAPKPLGMSGADDWTIDIETKGLPELKTLYKLLGAGDNVMAKAHKEFKHNYNQVSREIMYNFFNRHLRLGHSQPVKEEPFTPVPPKELSVHDAEHPVPKDTVNAEGIRRWWRRQADEKLEGLLPNEKSTFAEYHRVLGTALRVMITDKLPAPLEVLEVLPPKEEMKDGLTLTHRVISRKDAGEAVGLLEIHGLRTKAPSNTTVVWVHPGGLASLWRGDKLVSEARRIMDARASIVAVEVLRTGATAQNPRPAVNRTFAGYTFGYNRPLLADRVHDILSAVAFAKSQGTGPIHLLGHESAGPWTLLAAGLSGDSITRTAADVNQFRFEKIVSNDDDMMLPGALRYGGLMTLAGLCAPHELYVHNVEGAGSTRFLDAAYGSAGALKSLKLSSSKAENLAVVDWLLR